MPKKEKIIASSLKEALEAFDLRVFKTWCKKYDPLLWKDFEDYDATVQKSAIAKMICNRTDLLGTEAHKKAIKWLSEHNTKGRIF